MVTNYRQILKKVHHGDDAPFLLPDKAVCLHADASGVAVNGNFCRYDPK